MHLVTALEHDIGCQEKSWAKIHVDVNWLTSLELHLLLYLGMLVFLICHCVSTLSEVY